ncbi:hypothetical protein ACIOV9_12765 [Pseudomonas iridis]|jgi:hypothetical protein|uniref:hypothetical protein n=1 Tax=Pseudomonas iridis TaxID=2710587 RepID=UPI0038032397
MSFWQKIFLKVSEKVQSEPAPDVSIAKELGTSPSASPELDTPPEPELMSQRLSALDQTWFEAGKSYVQLSKGTKLWHAGVIGPDNHPKNDCPIWTTNDLGSKGDYIGFARNYGKQINRKPFLTEFVTTRELKLADFNCESLSDLTLRLCGANHDRMKAAVGQWLEINNLDGIVRVNRVDDEVVIRSPAKDILAVKYEEI